MKKIVRYLLIGLVALITVIGTLAIPKTVTIREDMKAMEFGYPISFITQDLTTHHLPIPWKYSFSSPWQNPFIISWNNFLLSYLIIFFSTTSIVIIAETSLVKNRKNKIT